ncbi:unnamed protein product [Amoebophrya sp. A120]|nr:unnamed protein product [Amoebophrya sp. A120]|eukprot:GSA120T00017291001.1
MAALGVFASCRDTAGDADDEAWMAWLQPVRDAFLFFEKQKTSNVSTAGSNRSATAGGAVSPSPSTTASNASSSSSSTAPPVARPSAKWEIAYRRKRDGGDLRNIGTVAVNAAAAHQNGRNYGAGAGGAPAPTSTTRSQPLMVAMRYAMDPYLLSMNGDGEDAGDANNQPSGICGFVTDFVWPADILPEEVETAPGEDTPADRNDVAPPDQPPQQQVSQHQEQATQSFGGIENCYCFGPVNRKIKVWQGEDPFANSYYDEDDPLSQPPKAVRFAVKQGLVVGGSNTGSMLVLSPDLTLAASGPSSVFPTRKRKEALDGTQNNVGFNVLDVAVLKLVVKEEYSYGGNGPNSNTSGFDQFGRYSTEEDPGPTAEQENQNAFMLNFISSATRNQAVNRNYFG